MAARSGEIIVKFHKNCEKQVKFWKFHMQDVILWNVKFLFSGSHEKSSLVLLQIANYIYSPWKMYKRKQHCFNYSDTRFFLLKIKITQFPDGFHLNFWLAGHGTSLSKGDWGRLKLRASYARKNIIPRLLTGVKNIKDLPWRSETFADPKNVCFFTDRDNPFIAF